MYLSLNHTRDLLKNTDSYGNETSTSERVLHLILFSWLMWFLQNHERTTTSIKKTKLIQNHAVTLKESSFYVAC